jgi:hypothetical protein
VNKVDQGDRTTVSQLEAVRTRFWQGRGRIRFAGRMHIISVRRSRKEEIAIYEGA